MGVAARRRVAPLQVHAGQPAVRHDFPAQNMVVRRADYLALPPEEESEHHLVHALTAAESVSCTRRTPSSFVASSRFSARIWRGRRSSGAGAGATFVSAACAS